MLGQRSGGPARERLAPHVQVPNSRVPSGPTIEHRVDEPLTVRFGNRIGTHPFAADLDTSVHGVAGRYRTSPPCSFHLHGGVTPPDSDGHPERLVLPGQTLTHRFPLRQYAANLWYHDHAMGITRANVHAGLAGMVLLRDGFDTGAPGDPLGLPAGEFEVPMVLQEKLFTADGQQSLRYQAANPQPPVGTKWTPPAPTAEELGFDPDASFPESPVPIAGNTMAATHPMPGELRGYVWHCHLLDHEDHEMMLRYRTVRG